MIVLDGWFQCLVKGFELGQDSEINLFLSSLTKLNSISSEKEMIEEYNCLKPCKFMEYKVS